MKKIEIPSITAVLNSIRRMPADELLLVIEAANFELAQAIDDERAKRDRDMLHNRTNALEGIK